MTRKLCVTGALVAIIGVAAFFAPHEAEATVSYVMVDEAF